MNLKQILQDQVIGKKIYDKYPVKKKEKTCVVEKARMDGLRAEYAKRLIENPEGKVEYK